MTWLHKSHAPGHPGIEPRWTSSAKSGVGTAIYQHLWFTLGRGIINEIYHPRIDRAALRDMGFIIGHGDWISEEKCDTIHEVEFLDVGAPAYRLTNTCKHNHYRIEKEIIGDPHRPVLLQRVKFFPLKGKLEEYRLYALAAPHLDNGGAHNTAWIADHKGLPLLLACREHAALAMGISTDWLKRSVGFVGKSDGYSDLEKHKRMEWAYERAEDGNVALMGEVDLAACKGEFVLALAFGGTVGEASSHAKAALYNPFDNAKNLYAQEWQDWQKNLLKLDSRRKSDGKNCYRIATQVIRTHESTNFPGGIIASLSIPWGNTKGDDDGGGYHVAWPRDLVMAAGGYLAAGAGEDALRVLGYLESVQEADGHWKQCLWLDGTPYLHKIQLDEAALPILLVDLAFRKGALADPARYWPMVRKAATYLVSHGPATPQDRWEEESGYTPFTLAACIAALLGAADLADLNHERETGVLLRDTADAWYDAIDEWNYVRGSDWCERFGVEGFYNRVTPNGAEYLNGPVRPVFRLKNVPVTDSYYHSDHMITVDALALVRFGLRAADDPRILNTLKLIDAMLKVDTPHGTAWRRYNGDGYGEKANGSAFDGTGIGRAWPVLAGERGHYELLAGHTRKAQQVKHDLESLADSGGMLPEQIWDTDDIPEKGLFFGKPTGSGNPLVWAHAEYVKLLRSLKDGAVFDLPPQTVERYIKRKTISPHRIWSFAHQIAFLPQGKILRLQVEAPAVVRWSFDEWKTTHEGKAREMPLGLHLIDLATQKLPDGAFVSFTFYWPDADRWEDRNFVIPIKIIP